MNRFLTKQGGVAGILIFVCGRCLVSNPSRALAGHIRFFVVLLIPSRGVLPYFNNYVIAATSQFPFSSSLLIIQPWGRGDGIYTATLTHV
jgi:hypothetical protein